MPMKNEKETPEDDEVRGEVDLQREVVNSLNYLKVERKKVKTLEKEQSELK